MCRSTRRVLEHFDTVKIGLTATPALHTVDILGKPVVTYGYREAVVDGFLIDHRSAGASHHRAQPGQHPFRRRRGGGIHPRPHRPTGAVQTPRRSPSFDVEAFNKTVITEPFNQAVARELTKHIDLSEPDKILVFAVSNAHADVLLVQGPARRLPHGPAEDIEGAQIREDRLPGAIDKVDPATWSRAIATTAVPRIAVIAVDLPDHGASATLPGITNLVFTATR